LLRDTCLTFLGGFEVIEALRVRFAATVRSIAVRRSNQLTIFVAAILFICAGAIVNFSAARSDADVGSAPAFVIDPNVATEAELLLLPRVGPSLAKEIVAERAKGRFESPRDVGRTRGIGEKTLQKLLPHLHITPRKP
jgi:competence protein ComEA